MSEYMLAGTLERTPQGEFSASSNPADVTVLWGSAEDLTEQFILPKWLVVGGLVGLVGVGVIIGRATKKRK